MKALVVFTLALTAAPALAQQPTVLDLTSFQTSDPAAWERLRRTSDSRPLTMEELEKLAAAGVGDSTLREMMRTRRVLALADADALLKMKKAGASDDALAAFSAYAYPPNDAFHLRVDLDVTSPAGVRQAPFLYIEVWHTERKRQEAFLHADLRGLLRRGARVEVSRDRHDPLLPETIRSVHIDGEVPTRTAGRIELRVLVSKRAGLRDLQSLPPDEAKRVRTFAFDYPAVSLDDRCQLQLELQRDRVLRDTYTLGDGRLQCWWD
ncbi:MAG: hypothetical protein H6704_21930 [Myxococcales bacterium]|nr:hypothetical protein [Myxococcales bacterium]